MQIDKTNIQDPVILDLIKERIDAITDLFSIIEKYRKQRIYIDIVMDLELHEKDAEERGLPLLGGYQLTLCIERPGERLVTVTEWDQDQDLGFVIFKS